MTEYEYSIIVRPGQRRPEMAEATSDEVAQMLTAAFMDTIESVAEVARTFAGGGWELISHELTALDHHLMMSFLMRRPKGGTALG